MALSVSEARERLEQVHALMARAAARFDDPPSRPDLVAVSKTFGLDDIRGFIEAGQRRFGENRVQEAKSKWPVLKQDQPGLMLHLIGPLQSNKVKDAVALFDVIETVDREKIAAALAVEMERTGRRLPVFVQVNIGEEPQKAGIAPGDAAAFAQRCREVHGLSVSGLMAIPPAGAAPGPYFAKLALLARDAAVEELSMGMSSDFEVAIEMGASHVRVGSVLFGERA